MYSVHSYCYSSYIVLSWDTITNFEHKLEAFLSIDHSSGIWYKERGP